jgi:hypothetical protein
MSINKGRDMSLRAEIAKTICEQAGVDFYKLPKEYQERNLKTADAIIPLLATYRIGRVPKYYYL